MEQSSSQFILSELYSQIYKFFGIDLSKVGFENGLTADLKTKLMERVDQLKKGFRGNLSDPNDFLGSLKGNNSAIAMLAAGANQLTAAPTPEFIKDYIVKTLNGEEVPILPGQESSPSRDLVMSEVGTKSGGLEAWALTNLPGLEWLQAARSILPLYFANSGVNYVNPTMGSTQVLSAGINSGQNPDLMNQLQSAALVASDESATREEVGFFGRIKNSFLSLTNWWEGQISSQQSEEPSGITPELKNHLKMNNCLLNY